MSMTIHQKDQQEVSGQLDQVTNSERNVRPGSQRLTTSTWSTLLMMAVLSAAFFMGNKLEWRVPKFSELVGTVKQDNDDWCKEHNVPESLCVNCRPELMPKATDHGWCMTHGVHNCLFEHPELAELKQPPDEAMLHGLAKRSVGPLMTVASRSNNSRCKNYLSRIQFASVQAVEQAGVEVELIETGTIHETITGNGEISFDPNRTAALASRQPGSISYLLKNVGDSVAKGELLALVDAKAVGESKSQLLRAMAEVKLQTLNVQRLQDANAAIARSRILDAEAALSKATADLINAEQSLRNLGLSANVDELRKLEESQAAQALKYLGLPDAVRSKPNETADSNNLLPIVAPIAGTVVERHATLGQVVDPSTELFKIVDSSQMWLMLSFPLESLSRVKLGQKILFKPTSSAQAVEGTIDWISPSADTHTRMVQVRSTLNNSDLSLRNNTFGSGQIVLRTSTNAVVVPSQSIHWEGCCSVVFVRDRHYFDSPDSPKVFHVRSVRVGTTTGTKTEVLAGLLPGEVIATAGSDVLRAQLLKTGLGAGCCVEE